MTAVTMLEECDMGSDLEVDRSGRCELSLAVVGIRSDVPGKMTFEFLER